MMTEEEEEEEIMVRAQPPQESLDARPHEEHGIRVASKGEEEKGQQTTASRSEERRRRRRAGGRVLDRPEETTPPPPPAPKRIKEPRNARTDLKSSLYILSRPPPRLNLFRVPLLLSPPPFLSIALAAALLGFRRDLLVPPLPQSLCGGERGFADPHRNLHRSEVLPGGELGF
ncbi:hypothetical protein NL676_021683 [Syzygium grande]|nr:hypothetical protein NL676_021683 [Syzygium grande]